MEITTKKIKLCPICGRALKVYGPEDWKPTECDPDNGEDPYNFVCDCGFHFDTDIYDAFEKAVQLINRRAST